LVKAQLSVGEVHRRPPPIGHLLRRNERRENLESRALYPPDVLERREQYLLLGLPLRCLIQVEPIAAAAATKERTRRRAPGGARRHDLQQLTALHLPTRADLHAHALVRQRALDEDGAAAVRRHALAGLGQPVDQQLRAGG